MNKIELIQAFGDANRHHSKREAEKVVELFFDGMANALTNGKRVEIRGFCSIFVKEYGAFISRNPKTGQAVKVSPKKLPCFKAGKDLKERVDRKEKDN